MGTGVSHEVIVQRSGIEIVKRSSRVKVKKTKKTSLIMSPSYHLQVPSITSLPRNPKVSVTLAVNTCRFSKIHISWLAVGIVRMRVRVRCRIGVSVPHCVPGNQAFQHDMADSLPEFLVSTTFISYRFILSEIA